MDLVPSMFGVEHPRSVDRDVVSGPWERYRRTRASVRRFGVGRVGAQRAIRCDLGKERGFGLEMVLAFEQVLVAWTDPQPVGLVAVRLRRIAAATSGHAFPRPRDLPPVGAPDACQRRTPPPP